MSHSRYDKTIKDFFEQAITNSSLKPILMEYENMNHQNAGKVIRWNIARNDCKCLIVLIGNRILFPPGYNYSFTHNWVGFEVGVAACRRIPIVVFEEAFENFNDIVPFPIPYLNHYVQYIQDENNSIYIGRVLWNIISLQKDMAPVDNLTCPWNHCKAEYSYWNFQGAQERMPCPACRLWYNPGEDISLTRLDDTSDIMPHF